MTDFPNADNSPGYSYAADPGVLAYHNARSTGTFTVAEADTTTITDVNVKVGDVVLLTAANAKAAAMIAGGTDVTAGIYVSSVVGGSFVVTHDNNATAGGSIFNYVVLPSF